MVRKFSASLQPKTKILRSSFRFGNFMNFDRGLVLYLSKRRDRKFSRKRSWGRCDSVLACLRPRHVHVNGDLQCTIQFQFGHALRDRTCDYSRRILRGELPMHFQHDEFRVRWQTPVRWDLNGAFCCCFHHGVLSVFVPRPDEDRLFERPRRSCLNTGRILRSWLRSVAVTGGRVV